MDTKNKISTYGNSTYTNEKYTRLANDPKYSLNLQFRKFLYQTYCIQDLKTSLGTKNGVEQVVGDIIDMGAGFGYKSLSLSNLLSTDHTLFVVEQNQYLLEKAKRTLGGVDKHIEFLQRDIFEMSNLGDITSNAGLITYNQVRHHYHEQKLENHLDMVYDNLKEGGAVSVLDFCKPNTAENIIERTQSKLFSVALKSYQKIHHRDDYYNNLTFSQRQELYERVGFLVDKDNSKEYNLLGIRTVLGTSPTTQTIMYK